MAFKEYRSLITENKKYMKRKGNMKILTEEEQKNILGGTKQLIYGWVCISGKWVWKRLN